MIKLTLFTPTYNRKEKLEQCYRRLCKQSNKEFIWLIIDDGSTDQTEDIIEEWKKEDIIKIEYIKQKNGGKYKAVNTGIINCKTELFAFCDSDDYYLPTTIDKFLSIWENIKEDQSIAGIVARRGNVDGEILGKKINIKEQKINFDKLIKKYKFYGDTCRMYRTNVLKKTLYPEIDEKFIPENVMFSKIDYQYDIYFINEAFSISEYLEGGYTKNYKELLNNNPNGYLLSLNQEITTRKGFFYRLKTAVAYTIFSWNRKIKAFQKCSNKLLYILALPISSVLYLLRIPKWYQRKNNEIIKKIKIRIKLYYYYIRSFVMKKSNILDAQTTTDYIIKNRKSIIRYGDGEYNFFRNYGVEYQEFNPELKEELKKIIEKYNEKSKYLLCMPKIFFQCNGFELARKRKNILWWSYARYYFNTKMDKDLLYGDAFVFAKQNKEKYAEIFKNCHLTKVIFVHHDEIYSKKFEKEFNIKTEYVNVPAQNSYSEIQQIYENIKNKITDKENELVLISAGPTAKVLVYKLSNENIFAIDTGHCWEKPLNAIEKREKKWGKQ